MSRRAARHAEDTARRIDPALHAALANEDPPSLVLVDATRQIGSDASARQEDVIATNATIPSQGRKSSWNSSFRAGGG